MSSLDITLRTGGDDLRGGSWGNLTVKLAGQDPIKFEKFTGTFGLPGGSIVTRTVDVPSLNNPTEIEFLQIEHVSQEDFGQTRDNWSMDNVQFVLRLGVFPVVVAEYGFHRFTGNSATVNILPFR